MAIDIEILGNQIKILGAPVFDGKPKYVNISGIKPEVNGDDVSLINDLTKSLVLPPVDFNDFDTPDGTALGSAILLADAIAALLPAPVAPGVIPDVAIVNPSTSGSELTPVAASASSVELLPALSTRVETRIRNDGTGILYVTIGATATVNSANKLLQDEFIDITEGLVVNGIWVGVNGFARMNELVK